MSVNILKAVHHVISYVKAGYLLHVITVIEVLIFALTYYCFDVASGSTQADWFMVKLVALSVVLCMLLFAQLDARSRYQNYKLVKDALYLHGFQIRILRPFMKSRCQRDAVIAAAHDLGLSSVCKEYFKSHGYRWYHILPDITFKQPSIFLTRNFWTTTLFTKSYRPKIDFKKINSLDAVEKKLPSIG
jgi:hypothetical protein